MIVRPPDSTVHHAEYWTRLLGMKIYEQSDQAALLGYADRQVYFVVVLLLSVRFSGCFLTVVQAPVGPSNRTSQPC